MESLSDIMPLIKVAIILFLYIPPLLAFSIIRFGKRGGFLKFFSLILCLVVFPVVYMLWSLSFSVEGPEGLEGIHILLMTLLLGLTSWVVFYTVTARKN